MNGTTTEPRILREDFSGSRPAPESLVAAVKAFPSPGFAVIDGGLFDDLPGQLRASGLLGRSLFLNHADIEIERAGPWLVALGQQDDGADRVLALVGSGPTSVFWACDHGEMALHRHLRTINQVRLSAWAAEGRSAPPDYRAPGEEERFETVLFRHWDPRVLGGLLPVLYAEQFGRLMGPAAEIAFLASDYGGLRRVVANPEWPRSSGLLRISSDQAVALAERQADAYHWRISNYLEAVAGDVLSPMPAGSVKRITRDAIKSGRSLGMTSEQAHCRWAYLMLMSEGRIARNPDARAFLAAGPDAPNERVGLLMQGIVDVLRGGSAEQLR